MTRNAIATRLESMNAGSTSVINDSVVTKWARDKFEVATVGKSTVSLADATDAIATPRAVAFSDLPHSSRMAFRMVIENSGGLVDGYQGDCVQVAIPYPIGPFLDAMQEAGLEDMPASFYYFPRPTGSKVDSLCHDGRYPGSRGFYQYANFRPIAV